MRLATTIIAGLALTALAASLEGAAVSSPFAIADAGGGTATSADYALRDDLDGYGDAVVSAAYGGRDGFTGLLINTAPSATGGALAARQDTPAQATFAATDPDGDATTLQVVAAPTHGAVAVVDAAAGIVRYTPAAGYLGADQFSLRVSDGQDLSAIVLVNVTVSNEPILTLTSTDLRAYEGWPLRLTITAAPAPSGTVTVDLAYGGSAVAGVDYTGPATVTLPPGTGTLTVEVPMLHDGVSGPTKTITIQLVNAVGGIIGTPDTVTRERRDCDGDGEPLGAFLTGKAVPFAASTGETLALVIHDGTPPYAIVTDNGGFVAGTPLAGTADLDGDGDLDLGERATVVPDHTGAQRITVTDAVGGSVILDGTITAEAAMVFSPAACALSPDGGTVYNAVGAPDADGLALLTALAGHSADTSLLISMLDAPSQQWFDLPLKPAAGLVPFNGFFVATRTDLPWSGQAVPAPVSYAIPLLPGNNFFTIPPLTDGTLVATSFPLSDFAVLDEFGVALSAADRTRLVGDQVFGWDGSAYVPTTTLESGKAYFMNNRSDGAPQTFTLRLNVLTNTFVPVVPPPPVPGGGGGGGGGGGDGSSSGATSGREPGSCGLGAGFAGIAGLALMLLISRLCLRSRR
jgi:hypothetical protein